MRNLKIAIWCALAVLAGASLAACTSSGGASAAASGGATPTPSSPAQGTFVPAASPLEGDWHQRFTCKGQVATFHKNMLAATLRDRRSLAKVKSNHDASLATLLKEFTREFAWGPNAKTATQLTPTALCKGAPDRQRTMRFQGSTLVVNDWDGSWGPASYKLVDNHTFTVDDGGHNFGFDPARSTDTFSFNIQGGTLALTMVGLDDMWAGTFLEEAPWSRVT